MENKKTPVYVRIDNEVKERATMYITNCKLMEKSTNTMSLLIEEALDQYMIDHPL